jgi:GNAT superfamily N-acetyltransferase
MNLKLSMRPAVPDDEPFLMRLRKLTMNEHIERVGQVADDAAHRARVMVNFEAAKIVCLGAEPIGLLKDYRADDEWVLVQIQLLPEHQGKGIGEQLIRTVLAQAEAAGLPVALSVLRGNPARRLYERLGFKEVEAQGDAFKLVWRPENISSNRLI